jgi:phenylalanyl-tRNA synthetase beta chain
MRISHKWLQTYFKKPLPSSEEIAELLTFHIFEVEGIEKKSDDDVLDVKVLPDRASYCLSHEGIARELSALLKENEFTPRQYEVIESSPDVNSVNVSVEAGDVCDVYNAICIMNVSKTSSPTWLVQKLEVVGQRSINIFADLANFIMFDIGQPMHVFDATKINGGITVRYSKEAEKITTLDNKEVILNSDIAIIADEKSPLAIAGIKGGKKAETQNFSSHVIVESAHFDASIIRKTSTKLNIKTDSSKRFENNVSATLAESAIKYFVSLLKKEDPEIMVSSISNAGKFNLEDKKVLITESFITEKLGKGVPGDVVLELLNKAHIPARRIGSTIEVTSPHCRNDLNIPEDIVDEVGRLYGYENVEGKLPEIKSPIVSNDDISYRNMVKIFLIENGFSEIQTYALAPRGEVEILNPLAEDKKFLRTNLSESIEKKLKDNIYYADLLGLNKIKVFEFGHVWKDNKEFVSLCVGIAYKKAGKDERVNDEIKEIRDKMFQMLSVDPQILCTVDDTGGLITLNNKQIGVTNNIEGITEMDFDALISGLPKLNKDIPIVLAKEIKKYKKLSDYPFMVRDIAVFVPGDKSGQDELWQTIERNAGDLMVRHELFDVFEKKNKETGEIEKTSFAFRLVFQSYEKTLTDDEINKIMLKIEDAVKGKGWIVR